MFFRSHGRYVLQGDDAHCVCYGPDCEEEAAMVAVLLNEHAMSQRLPHPATQMGPLPDLAEVLHGDAVGRHD